MVAAIDDDLAGRLERPWWRLQPGNEIEVLFCSPIETLAAGDDSAAVDALRAATRSTIAGALEAG